MVPLTRHNYSNKFRSLQPRTGLPRWLSGKESACNAGDMGLILRSGRSSGEGNGNPLQYSSLRNPMNRGAWWATVRGVTGSQTRLSNWAHTRSGTSLLFEYSRPDGVWRGAPLHRALFCLHICPSEMSLRSLTHLFNQIFSHCWILRILCIFWRTILYQVCLPQIFPPSLWLLLIFYFVCWKV